MFGRAQPVLQPIDDLRQVAREERFPIKPEARKNVRSPDSIGIGRKKLITAVDQNVPTDFLPRHHYRQILGNSCGLIKGVFRVQIVGSC